MPKCKKNLIDAGLRPSLASLRVFAIFGANTEGSCPVTNMASACLDAKADPALCKVSELEFFSFDETYGEVPAWNKNGVLCGDGSTICLVSKLKHLP